MINSLILAAAPVFILAFYIYYRDKYEKEPFTMLVKALVAGMIIVIPILIVEIGISALIAPFIGTIKGAALNAFAVASFTEEGFKWLAVLIIFFGSRQFNERFDGIVYAGFISLGFALIENILYVMVYSSEGNGIAYMRAVSAVPAHMLFGVIMGYRFGLAKFLPSKRGWNLFMAFFMPFLLHGIYDFLLMVEKGWALLIFFPFVLFLWIFGLVRMKRHSLASEFNNFKWTSGGPTDDLHRQ